MNETVFVVDDEKDIVELVIFHLSQNGFKTRGFSKSTELLKTLPHAHPDLVLLDLMLPDIDGLELCKKLKSNESYKRIPIIMLTARGHETDKVLGLEVGADDYVTKPFSPKELVARVKAVLRRGREAETENTIKIGGRLILDPQRREIRDSQGATIELTKTEFDILHRLAGRKGWVFPREKLLSEVWGDAVYVSDRNIDVHIRHLREKLGTAGELIVNVRGVGYKLAE